MKDFQSLMADFEAAERSGVFARTPQPVMASSVTDGNLTKFFLVSPKWAIAAVLIMAVGVWTMMFRAKLLDVQNRSRMVQMAKVIDLQSALDSCVGGPSGTLGGMCGRVDFDGDGDVDLCDVGTYQRELAGSHQ